MGLLDQLWDDTVAGPRPDSGLGKLRKHSTFSFRSNSGKESEIADNRKSFAEEAAEEAVRVTRSIMIVKPPQAAAKDSPPASPAGSTTPVSPFPGPVDPVVPLRDRRDQRLWFIAAVDVVEPTLLLANYDELAPCLGGA
ncbi:UNVERIFIED_CONTAM: Dormancy-associated protein3 [Sesamum radiatum]|uniref:Dormancy-associated protein3 n=1 Tax=Sesamum radiatum TaxID=300843 RepID=A0AAW2S6Z7_SESRA